ncbi:MAG: glycosyltransferase [candidate division Zixibacteria bacterium]|nr:glycosyltransferase [candidate division Zixibacteria bacterium]
MMKNNDRQTALILYASTGSGHLAASTSLKQAWKEMYPQDDVYLEDVLTYTNSIFSSLYSKGYDISVTKTPWLWGILYSHDEEITKYKPPTPFGWSMRNFILKRFIRKMVQVRPDYVVSTHFLASDSAVLLRKLNRFDFHYSIIVTDFALHSIWLSPWTDRVFVPAEFMKSELLAIKERLNLNENKIGVHGIPINPKYCNLPDKSELRKKFNLDPDILTLLVFRDVFSQRNFDLFVHFISNIDHPLQLILVAGKQWPLPEKYKKIFVENRISYRIFGYIDFMEELMAVADLAISKSGGLTTSECLAAGLPLAVYRPYPGQEEHNAEYLLEHGAGFKITQMASLQYRLRQLIEDREKREAMSEAASGISNPEAAYNIVKDLKSQSIGNGKKA